MILFPFAIHIRDRNNGFIPKVGQLDQILQIELSIFTEIENLIPHIVSNYLIKLGVKRKQLSHKGNGIKNQISINKYTDGSYVWQSLPYNRRVEFNIIKDPLQKLKIRRIKIPVLYDINPDPDKIKKEFARLDSVFTIQLGAYKQPISQKHLKKIKNLQMFYTGNLYKYSTGEFKSLKKARKELIRIKDLGFDEAYIRKLIEYFPNKIKTLK